MSRLAASRMQTLTTREDPVASDRIGLASSITVVLTRPGSRAVFFEQLLHALLATRDAQRGFAIVRDDDGGEMAAAAAGVLGMRRNTLHARLRSRGMERPVRSV